MPTATIISPAMINSSEPTYSAAGRTDRRIGRKHDQQQPEQQNGPQANLPEQIDRQRPADPGAAACARKIAAWVRLVLRAEQHAGQQDRNGGRGVWQKMAREKRAGQINERRRGDQHDLGQQQVIGFVVGHGAWAAAALANASGW